MILIYSSGKKKKSQQYNKSGNNSALGDTSLLPFRKLLSIDPVALSTSPAPTSSTLLMGWDPQVGSDWTLLVQVETVAIFLGGGGSCCGEVQKGCFV